MTRRRPALENVSVRVKDSSGNTKAYFSTVEKFVNFVTSSTEEGWYNKNNTEPQISKPWYQKLFN